ncbi:MAG: hypothetical protein ACRC62_16540 [Microcoleus sp.]
MKKLPITHYQLSTVNCQLSIVNSQSIANSRRSHYHSQLSTI